MAGEDKAARFAIHAEDGDGLVVDLPFAGHFPGLRIEGEDRHRPGVDGVVPRPDVQLSVEEAQVVDAAALALRLPVDDAQGREAEDGLLPGDGGTGEAGTVHAHGVRKVMTYENWLFWWAYNRDDILNVKERLDRPPPRSCCSL